MPVSYRNDLSAQRLREVMTYNPETGDFSFHEGPRAGKNLRGSINKYGYLRISVDGVLYYAHRLAWLYVTGQWPDDQIDHRDMNKSNNTWSNLRDATAVTNGYNIRAHDRNASGFKGVYLCKRTGRYYAQINVNRKSIHLGHFATAEEANAVRVEAAHRYHGEFARAA